MAVKDERTLQMMREYWRLHMEEGLSPKEIALRFGLTPTTVYQNLDEIARMNGVTRQELLDQPHEKPISYDRTDQPVTQVEPRLFLDLHRKAIEDLDRELNDLEKIIDMLEKEISEADEEKGEE